MIRLDPTNALVFGVILLMVAAASWYFIGWLLVWAAWQVFLYFVLLATLAGLFYFGLHLAFGREE